MLIRNIYVNTNINCYSMRAHWQSLPGVICQASPFQTRLSFVLIVTVSVIMVVTSQIPVKTIVYEVRRLCPKIAQVGFTGKKTKLWCADATNQVY